MSAEEFENTGDESDESSKISELELERFSSQKIVKRKITEIEEDIHCLLIYMLKLVICKFVNIKLSFSDNISSNSESPSTSKNKKSLLAVKHLVNENNKHKRNDENMIEILKYFNTR